MRDSLLLSLQTSSAQRMRVVVSLSRHAGPSFTQRMRVILAWTGRETTGTGLMGPRWGPAPRYNLDGFLLRSIRSWWGRNVFILFIRMSIPILMTASRQRCRISARRGPPPGASRSARGSPGRTGAASPETGPPTSRRWGSDGGGSKGEG